MSLISKSLVFRGALPALYLTMHADGNLAVFNFYSRCNHLQAYSVENRCLRVSSIPVARRQKSLRSPVAELWLFDHHTPTPIRTDQHVQSHLSCRND